MSGLRLLHRPSEALASRLPETGVGVAAATIAGTEAIVASHGYICAAVCGGCGEEEGQEAILN